MDTLDDFNWELKLFLTNLTKQQTNSNKVNPLTLQLFSDILLSINGFIKNATIDANNNISKSRNNDEDDDVEYSPFLKLDEKKFEIRHLITCRVCHLQIALTKRDYLNHITSESHNLAIIKNKNDNPNLFQTNSAASSQLLAKNNNARNIDSNGLSSTGSGPGQSNQRLFAQLNAGIANGPMNLLPGANINKTENRNIGQNNTVATRSTAGGAIPKNNINNNNISNNNRNGENNNRNNANNNNNHNHNKNNNANRNNSNTNNRNNYFNNTNNSNNNNNRNNHNHNRSNSNSFSRESSCNRNGNNANNQAKNIAYNELNATPSMKIAPASQSTPIASFDVFDDDIFKFIDSQSAQPSQYNEQHEQKQQERQQLNQQQNRPQHQQNRPQNQQNRQQEQRNYLQHPQNRPQQQQSRQSQQNLSDNTVMNVSAGSSHGADMKPVPPYMMNSLYLAYDKKQREKRDRLHQPQPLSRSNESQQQQPQSQQRPVDCNSNNSSVVDDKLDKIFAQINKKKSMDATTGTQSIDLFDDLESDTQSLIGTASSGQRPIAPLLQRSSSTISLNLSVGSNSPRRYVNNGNANRYNNSPKKVTVEILQEYFARDLSRILCHTMDEGLNLVDLPAYKQITNDLEKHLQGVFPKIKCHVFGTRLTGVGNNQTPLDIYVDLFDSYSDEKSQRQIQEGMNETRDLLKENPIWNKVQLCVRTCRQLVIMTHEPTKIFCYLSFDTGLSVNGTKAIQAMFNAQPVCRQLVLCIRASLVEMPSKQMEQFNGYIVSLLVIFYFQNRKLLPPVRELEENCDNKILAEYPKLKNITICKDRFYDILMSFFEFYVSFSFRQNIVSVYEGQNVHYTIRNQHEPDLSPSLLRFKDIVNSYSNNWRPDKTMCVQDILIHTLNVAKTIHYADVCRFQIYCKEALEVLRNLKNSVNY